MLWVRHRFTGFLRAVTARLRAWAAGDFAAFLMAMPWVVVLRRGVFWLKRPWLLMLRLRDMSALYRSRQQLAALDPRLRADLGLDDRDVDAELARPLAGAASPWAEDEVKQACSDAKANQLLKAFFITRARNLRRHETAAHAIHHEFKLQAMYNARLECGSTETTVATATRDRR